MKVLHVITRSEIGGAQVVVLNLIRSSPSEIELLVAAGEQGYMQDECKKLGVTFHLIPRLVRSINPLNDWIALIQLVLLIRREKVDIVHCHTSKAGVLGRIAAWLARTPSIFTAHTWSFDEGISRLQRLVSIPIEKFAAFVGGPIITVSEANRRKALRHRIAPPSKVIRIWLGIPDHAPAANPGHDGPVSIIMTARFAQQKDHATLLRAAAGLTGNWNLVMVGEGPLLPAAVDLARELGIHDKVSFLGARSDVPSLLAQSSVFVLATRWEGLPVSILEAMRAGLPVVATNVGGNSEMVDDGVSGYLTRVVDVEQLRHCIQALVDSADLRCQMGSAARNRYERDFRMATCVHKHVALYQSCLPAFREEVVLKAKAIR